MAWPHGPVCTRPLLVWLAFPPSAAMHATVKTQLAGPQTQDPLWVEKPVRCPRREALGPSSGGEDTQPHQISALTRQHHRPAQREKGYNSSGQSAKRKDSHPHLPGKQTTVSQTYKFSNSETHLEAGSGPLSQELSHPGEGGGGPGNPRRLQGPGLPPVGSVSSQDVGSSTVFGKAN